MNPLLLAGAAAVAAASYYLLNREEDFADCFDENLTPNIRAELVKMFQAESGAATVERLLERAQSYRNVAKILGESFPKATRCSIRRAEQLEAVIRAEAQAAKEGRARPKPGVSAPPTTPAKTTKKKAAPKVPKGTPSTVAVLGKFKLPADAGPAREARIKELFMAGRFRPVSWSEVDCSIPGTSCTVYVSSDALALGDDENFVRVNVGHRTAEELAIMLGDKFGRTLFLPTTRIMDKAYAQAPIKLQPMTFPAGPDMDDTSRMYDHSRRIERALAGRKGLVRPVGKGWVSSAFILGEGTWPAAKYPKKTKAEDLATNFGWHWEHANKYKSPGGAKVIQPMSNFHAGNKGNYTDYSQTVTVVRGDALVNGKVMALQDLLRHPTLSATVSDEGPLTRIRHPSQPDVAPSKPALSAVS